MLYFKMILQKIKESKIFRFMEKISNAVIKVINFVLLLPVYFIGVYLTSLIGKLFKKRFLDLELSNTHSYYIMRKSMPTKEEFYRQF